MDCQTILSLITLGGVALGVASGTVTELILAKRGYQPTNYLALWQAKWQARSGHALPAHASAQL